MNTHEALTALTHHQRNPRKQRGPSTHASTHATHGPEHSRTRTPLKGVQRECPRLGRQVRALGLGRENVTHAHGVHVLTDRPGRLVRVQSASGCSRCVSVPRVVVTTRKDPECRCR